VHVVLTVLPSCGADLRSAFCDEVVFTKDAETGARRVAGRPSTWAVPLHDATSLAHSMVGATGPIGSS
jgi:hypothetical protein